MKIFNHKLNIELLVGTVAILTSVISIFIYLEQLKISREQQKASVYPYLWLNNGLLDKNYFYFKAENKGVGPAFIKKIKISFQHKEYDSFEQLFTKEWQKKNGSTHNHFPFYFESLETGNVLKEGEELTLYSLKYEETLAYYLKYQVVDDTTFHYQIWYADVYGGCFLNQDNNISVVGKCTE